MDVKVLACARYFIVKIVFSYTYLIFFCTLSLTYIHFEYALETHFGLFYNCYVAILDLTTKNW